MPVVKIDMWEGRSEEDKEKMIKAIYRALEESLGIPKEWTTVIINDVPKSNWGLNGEQASKMKFEKGGAK
ncbi:MAG: 4-oxalocrotonate tautomerase family protein [Candidatus Diapherotrites archaeon]